MVPTAPQLLAAREELERAVMAALEVVAVVVAVALVVILGLVALAAVVPVTVAPGLAAVEEEVPDGWRAAPTSRVALAAVSGYWVKAPVVLVAREIVQSKRAAGAALAVLLVGRKRMAPTHMRDMAATMARVAAAQMAPIIIK